MNSHPSPLDLPQLTTRIDTLDGVEFDGTQWVMIEEAVWPVEEICLIVAASPDVVERSAASAHIALALAETSYGYVLDFQLTLPDHPRCPFWTSTQLNPAPELAREWLRRLAGQTVLTINIYDRDSGEPITTRRVPFHRDLRQALLQVLEETEGCESSPFAWCRAVASYRENSPPPPGHVRLPERSDPKVGRNEPCPCGSTRKFKRCCGR